MACLCGSLSYYLFYLLQVSTGFYSIDHVYNISLLGMALIDSLDSMLMLFTYTWAYVNPVRKLFYNLTITSISVVVAIVVALIELFSMIGEQLELYNGWWRFWYFLSDSFEYIGIIIVSAFIITWVVSAIIYRLAGYRQLEREFDTYDPERIRKTALSDERLKVTDEKDKAPDATEMTKKSDISEVV